MINRILCCLVLLLPVTGEAVTSSDTTGPSDQSGKGIDRAGPEFVEFCRDNIQDLPLEEADLRLECLFLLLDHYAAVGEVDNWKNLYAGLPERPSLFWRD